MPGLTIALVRKGRSRCYTACLQELEYKGTDHRDTVFEAASSASCLCFAVLKLVDAGKFDLDKPLNHICREIDVGPDPASVK